jgi:LysM repeat protein
MKFYLSVLLCIVNLSLFAQPGTVPTEVVNGKKYYIHTVEQGNTLYGLQRTYGVPVESIIRTNPGVDKGLNVGQKVRIEVPLETIVHEVQKKETLFAISKKYGVSVDAILEANPGAESGINVGEKLKIPGVEKGTVTTAQVVVEETNSVKDTLSAVSLPSIKVSFTDSVIEHIVLGHETLYSISKRFMVPVEELQQINGLRSSKIKPGDKLKIPVKKESVQQIPVREVPSRDLRRVDSSLLYPKKDTYRVAVLLPFNLDKPGDALGSVSTDFYMGMKLALDSLERQGLKAQVFVHDVKSDTLSLKKILQKPEMSTVDLVIGPLMADNAEIVARWCKNNEVRMVCPVSASTGMLKNNPFVYHAVPSDVTLMQGLARFVLDNHSRDQIILIQSTLEKDKSNFEAFYSAFMALNFQGNRPKVILATLENYSTFLKKGVNSVIVFPTIDRAMALKFDNGFSVDFLRNSQGSIHVYGTKEWMSFDGLTLHNTPYIFNYAAPNDFSYADETVKTLHKKYRKEYTADMSKYAVQGFDVTYFFLSELFMKKSVRSGIMNEFKIVQTGSGNGYENSKVYIIRQQDGEFISVK